MGKRKVFLLFLSAMSLSIIVMMIIYGLFIKDIEFNLKVRNPESAPSPIENIQEEPVEVFVEEDEKTPAKVSTPDQLAQQQSEENEQALQDELMSAEETEDSSITEVVPLEPQVESNYHSNLPVPQASSGSQLNGNGPDVEISRERGENGTASHTLHFVYLDGFSSKQAAEEALKLLQQRNLAAQPYIRQHNGQVILQFGVFSDRENAEIMAEQLRSQNIFVKVD